MGIYLYDNKINLHQTELMGLSLHKEPGEDSLNGIICHLQRGSNACTLLIGHGSYITYNHV